MKKKSVHPFDQAERKRRTRPARIVAQSVAKWDPASTLGS
ncbi:hypothetical protein L917_11620 [Phytophthora nicotianae]|uniref:Uncharacterized protein n=2 Tax=Phytophthora nicotianae TaxID=4792 RepID=W2KWG8_PHYNI|nr:hypothetical protein L917_11620 [Phytophthora nicotianae]ETO71455.1 hypothetical protein F444_12221 [Phytophthora nicotianae P1976]